MLVRMMEKIQKRGEGKRSGTWKKMVEEREEMERGREEAERGREEEKRKREESEKKRSEEKKRRDEEKRELEERIERMQKEMEEMKKKGGVCGGDGENRRSESGSGLSIIRSLDGTSVVFTPNDDGIKREGNRIIHEGLHSNRHCFIGGVITSVYFSYLLLFHTIYLSSFLFSIPDLCLI